MEDILLDFGKPCATWNPVPNMDLDDPIYLAQKKDRVWKALSLGNMAALQCIMGAVKLRCKQTVVKLGYPIITHLLGATIS